jgi:hypothetical protein
MELSVAGIGDHVQDPDQRCGGTKDDASTAIIFAKYRG